MNDPTETFPESAQTRGASIVGHALGWGLMSALINKGLLTTDEAQQTIDGLLRALEGLPQDDGMKVARILLDQMGQQIAGGPALAK